MPRRTLQLAKLTRPRLARTVGRERLFTLLDDARKTQSVVCVVSPPRAGKTTLVRIRSTSAASRESGIESIRELRT